MLQDENNSLIFNENKNSVNIKIKLDTRSQY